MRFGAVTMVLVALVGCTPLSSIGPLGTQSASASATPGPVASGPSGSPAEAGLQVIVDGLVAPIGLVTAPGRDDGFVVDQTGSIAILRGDRLLPDPFLDVRDRLVGLDPGYDERGLLGLSFHPDFATNGRLFVYYGTPPRTGTSGVDHVDRLSEFRLDSGAPDRVDPATERVILEIDQPQPNHSGGGLGFGPDGYLYLGTGDGGGEGDASPGHSLQGNAQDPQKLNGKILRLDLDHPPAGRTYGTPPDNPYTGGDGRPEIYALGFRNPWRLSWEPDGQRRLLASDVGYGRYEEIDVVGRGGNYGWRIREGAHCLDLAQPLSDLADCPNADVAGAPLIDPVVEYSHSDVGIAVVGGYVYRGSALPALRGAYVFADFTADWRGVVPTPRASLLVALPSTDVGRAWEWRRLRLEGGLVAKFITGMGEDAAGELYVLARDTLGPTGHGGVIYRLVAPGV
jgi:glucose/arabinose dehydrogenase